MVAHHQAGLLDLVARVADATTEASGLVSDDDGEFAADEIRAALVSHPAGGACCCWTWPWSCERLPELAEALRSGLVDLPRARVVCDEVATLDDEEAQQVVSVVLERASTQTTGQLAARVRRLVLTVDPAAAKERYERGVEGRRVELSANPDGTANLIAWSLPAERANAAYHRLDHLAQAAKGGRLPQLRSGASRRPLGPGGLWGRLGAARCHRPPGRPGHPGGTDPSIRGRYPGTGR